MNSHRLSKVRRLAVALVLGNLALVAVLGSVLPQAALVLLPIVAFTVPLLSAAAIEEAIKTKPTPTARPVTSARRLGSALQHAA